MLLPKERWAGRERLSRDVQGKHHPVNVFEVGPPGMVADPETSAVCAAGTAFSPGALSAALSMEAPAAEYPLAGPLNAAGSEQAMLLPPLAPQLKPIVGRQVCRALCKAEVQTGGRLGSTPCSVRCCGAACLFVL